ALVDALQHSLLADPETFGRFLDRDDLGRGRHAIVWFHVVTSSCSSGSSSDGSGSSIGSNSPSSQSSPVSSSPAGSSLSTVAQSGASSNSTTSGIVTSVAYPSRSLTTVQPSRSSAENAASTSLVLARTS